MVQGDMDPELRTTIQRVIGETDRPIENRFEARRRAGAAAEDAIAVLRSEGYYANQVEADVSEADPPRPLVQIVPGQRFAIGAAAIAWQGAAPDAASEAAATKAMALTSGAPGRAVDVIAAEGRVVVAVQKRGYADAVAEPREVIVDHADHTVRPTYHIAAGMLVRMDGLDITPGGRTNPDWLRRLAPWNSGDTYDPEDVAELERRLLDTSVYDSVTVGLAPPEKATADGLRPVVVSLSERKPRTIEGGASYATSDGAGVNARWTHYNRLRRADTMALYGQISVRDTRAGVEVTLPHWLRPAQTLKTGAAAYKVRTDAYDETGFGVNADVTRRYGKTSYVTAGLSADYSQTKELTSAGAGMLTTLGRDLFTLQALADLLMDRSNDPLNPTQGWRLSARIEPTLILGDTNLPYLRAVAQGTYYQPLDKQARTVLAGRLRLGRILNGTVDQIPASQRFYAGGGGSVRGFPYQAVGPRLDDNTPRGGVFLFESSFEVRRDLTPKWGMAAFVDAGAVGSSGPIDFQDLAVGIGLGVRYNLGFAPIRVDVATPVARRKGEQPIQVYVSIGQSF
ncbi:MAG: autotransporter assembly complex protein TamA [Alphaproteobacteria bacterium]|nr:autotransporter assembly complex protein TamA [Alphaproteobacteria bacterium]MBU1516491.1 autotransporter assembly complex protein TamA [Alphaproteobacteria bacterium]MBU2094248.1 autotransporter assembly complex protein TamA [Alphaproteobacteria bacterium]MBU2154175.1 autotransporter assembly complex protein TamA [Alphaproteobacteria bacterium]MBU2307418.1 autotransporter assembly complex protein TamA [Alphaproteobacteria bacterium]